MPLLAHHRAVRERPLVPRSEVALQPLPVHGLHHEAPAGHEAAADAAQDLEVLLLAWVVAERRGEVADRVELAVGVEVAHVEVDEVHLHAAPRGALPRDLERGPADVGPGDPEAARGELHRVAAVPARQVEHPRTGTQP